VTQDTSDFRPTPSFFVLNAGFLALTWLVFAMAGVGWALAVTAIEAWR